MYSVTTIVLVNVGLCFGVSHVDLVAMEPACSPRYSCELDNTTSLPLEWYDKNCMCDELCAEYGDCCLNSEYYDVDRHKDKVKEHQCVELTEYGDVYMTGKCMEGWQDEHVSSLCLSGSPGSSRGRRDPAGDVPVTSLHSAVTYTNYYCAICNNDTRALRVWPTRWECDTLSEHFTNFTSQYVTTYVITNLEFRDEDWGVNVNNNGSQEFHTCSIFTVLPEGVKNITRKCSAAVTTCGEDWHDADVADSCHSYTAVVYDYSVPYRNPDCAKCNSVTQEQLSCVNQNVSSRERNFNVQAFAILFDFTDTSGSNVVGLATQCQESEIWDPFFRKCRSVVCAKPNQKFQYGECVAVGDINDTVNTEPTDTEPFSSPSTDGTAEMANRDNKDMFRNDNNPIFFPGDARNTHTGTVPPPATPLTNTVSDTAVSSNVSNESLGCNSIFLSDDEFTLYENGTVFVEAYDRLYPVEEYALSDGGVLVCALQTSTHKFSQAMGWVSLVGLAVSCVCLVLHLVAFMLVSDLRNLSGNNLASLCLALLISYIIFIVNVFTKPSENVCVVLAGVMYYFLLCSSAWMSTVAFDIWYTFRRTKTQLRVTGGKQWHKFVAYSVYSWLLPAVATTVLIVVHVQQPVGIPEEYLPGLGRRWCWFGHRKALLVFFAIPVVTIIIINSVFFISTARIIAETTSSTSTSTTSSHHKHQYKMYLRLAVLTGFTWLTGIVAGYLQLEATWYIFVVLNTLHGVYIFLAFTCRSKVWRTVASRCCHVVQRGASRLSGRAHPGGPVVELSETLDHQAPADG